MGLVGTVTRKASYHRSIAGELSFAGALGSMFKRKVFGVLSFAGDLTSLVAKKNLFGALGVLAGVLTAKLNGVDVGVVGILKIVCNKIKGIRMYRRETQNTKVIK